MKKVDEKKLMDSGFHVEVDGIDLDLVCGMEVNKNSKFQVIHKRNMYYFCSEGCKKHFKDNPEKYLG